MRHRITSFRAVRAQFAAFQRLDRFGAVRPGLVTICASNCVLPQDLHCLFFTSELSLRAAVSVTNFLATIFNYAAHFGPTRHVERRLARSFHSESTAAESHCVK